VQRKLIPRYIILHDANLHKFPSNSSEQESKEDEKWPIRRSPEGAFGAISAIVHFVKGISERFSTEQLERLHEGIARNARKVPDFISALPAQLTGYLGDLIQFRSGRYSEDE
jgi:hypothetical protein